MTQEDEQLVGQLDKFTSIAAAENNGQVCLFALDGWGNVWEHRYTHQGGVQWHRMTSSRA